MTTQETHTTQEADLRRRDEVIAGENAARSPENREGMRGDSLSQALPQAMMQEGADTILLVDDEPHVISALNRTLRNFPYQVLTAGSGSQALSIMETTIIKVIVSDEQMVGMRGTELLAEVQRRFPHTVRIMLTGHATLEATTRAVNEGGVYRFLTKPWDEAILLLSLSAATEKYNSDAEKRRLQDALQQSEERYRTVVEQSPQPVVVHRDGTIIYANPAAIRMFGATSLEDLAGKPLLDRIHPDDHEAVLARVQKMTSDGARSPMVERRYRKFDGTIIDGEVQGTPIIYDGVPAIHAAIHDITERKQVQKALEEERRRLQQALDEVRTLRGIVPICAYCKKIRDDAGYWNQVEKYVSDHTDAKFSHGICPACFEKEMREIETST